MRSYIGFHACSQEGGYSHVLSEAPFLSKWPQTQQDEEDQYIKDPFLGEGYYFWQSDLHRAKRWGEMLYGDYYFVLKASINTTLLNFLDLVGEPDHIGAFELACIKLVNSGAIETDFTLGEAIEYMKKANIFPWKIIRCKEFTNGTKKQYFRRDSNSFTLLRGNFIFCLVEKNELILTEKVIVFKSLS